MKIAVLGAGFTGLTAALRLSQKGHQVVIFEKEKNAGGLAGGFKEKGWDWSLEKSYHHWFTSDDSILNLAKELKIKTIVKTPKTDVYINCKSYSFDSAKSVLKFPLLALPDKIRLGLGTLYMKLVINPKEFEKKKAVAWIKKVMGEKVTNLIWQPLLYGKFGKYCDQISLSWFWARIKKRTRSLAYPEGGFDQFTKIIIRKIKNCGGDVKLSSPIESLKTSDKYCLIKSGGQVYKFDKVLVTLPTPIFTKITKGLPKSYSDRISSIPHLSAHVLILVLKKPFMKDTYWLNVLEENFPFLVVVEHTNFMDINKYGGRHIIYVGNYLPHDHPLLSKSATRVLKIYDPFLKLFNNDYKKNLLKTFLFKTSFAQPVVTTNYTNKMPSFKTPLKNIYIANMDMVYPWDRGTNYAVEMGEKAADVMVV